MSKFGILQRGCLLLLYASKRYLMESNYLKPACNRVILSIENIVPMSSESIIYFRITYSYKTYGIISGLPLWQNLV